MFHRLCFYVGFLAAAGIAIGTNATGAALAASNVQASRDKTDADQDVLRFTLQLSEFGDGSLRIETTSQPPQNDFSGQSFNLSSQPKTRVIKGQDGIFQLNHAFSSSDVIDGLATQRENVTVDDERGLLVLAPARISECYPVRRAKLYYGRRFRPPLTLSFDIVQYGGGHFAILASYYGLGLLQVHVWSPGYSLDSPFSDSLYVDVKWFEFGNAVRGSVTLLDAEAVKLEEPYEEQFRLPLPNAEINTLVTLGLSKVMGHVPMTISRLEVRGRLVPLFGVKLDEMQGKIFVKQVFSESLAQAAGIQSGDVVLAVNGNRPETLTEAVHLFSQIPIGDEAVFSIRRGDETLEIQVVAE